MKKSIFLLAFIFIFCWTCLAFGECSGPADLESEIHFHPSASLYGELGNWFANHNQPSCAVETFRTGLRLVPDSADLLYLLGLTLNSNGNPKDAVPSLQQAVRIEPDVIEYHLLLGSVYNELQQQNQARHAFEHALAIDPHSITALHGLSQVLIAQGRYQKVVKLLSSAPHDETLTLDLAQAYDKAHMYMQADQILSPAVRRDPLSTPLTLELANVYISQKRYPEALRLAEKSFQLHPNEREVQDTYLHALVLNRDFDKAHPLGQLLIARHRHDFEVIYWNGILARDEGQYNVARLYLEEAVMMNPTHSSAHYNLGIVLFELDDYTGAKDELEKSLCLGAGTEEPQVRYRLASVLRTMGKTEQARKQYKLTEQELQAISDRKFPYQPQGC